MARALNAKAGALDFSLRAGGYGRAVGIEGVWQPRTTEGRVPSCSGEDMHSSSPGRTIRATSQWPVGMEGPEPLGL